MIWEKITDARKRMDRARRKLFEKREAQFWGTLGLTMDLVETTDIERMATDARSIFYNPDFVMRISEAECMFVIAHEISHPALRHFQRLTHLPHDLANMAGDYEINLDLIKAGLTPPTGDDAPLLDWRFDGMTAEQIANVISKENKEDEKNGNEPRHKPASGNIIHPTDDETGQPMSGDQMAELATQWEQKTAQVLGAARKAGQMAGGHIPSALVAVSNTLKTPNIIDWRQPLRAFIDRLGSTQSSWAKMSRRALGRGQVLPGQRVIRPSLVGFFIDVSGSMDANKVQQALIEAQAALDDMACDAIEVVYTNTVVMGVDHYEAGDTIAFKDATSGGTNFDAAMTHAADQGYAAIVFLTDGQTRSWGNEPDCPVLWAITDTLPATEKLAPPYGEKLCLYTS